ncbi:YcjF family protein [Bradyrhizobium erythrophlei]|uniref:Putative membrane protein n=1 Tax=Bradyrhizobium erythrophlei TaxID=1437360 RepID=A0A1M7U7T8_9BRAD|nr:TIGR01620 family protein [Bradyrhizobium erythrophlei]SHN79033.1 putative membrane protein [Bradyrhizobium erythrophlei]
MSERSYRRPATFKLDDAKVVVTDASEQGHPARGTIHVTPEDDAPQLPVAIEPTILPAERRFRWGTLFWGAVGGLVLLGAGLGVAHLIEDLFARSDSLGFLGLALTLVATLSLLVIAAREAICLMRLSTIEELHRRAAAVIVSDDRNESRNVLRDLLKIAHANPHLARARATLTHHSGDIIDGADMIRLAERELMSPLDQEARMLISAAAQRVSLVTAISPRALFDVAFVFAASLRLIRQLALLYGGRPGTLGMIKLIRHVLAHLAITGGMAASDSVIQQILGHGLTAKLSQRLGEGFLNGLLTARLGLAAIDLTRPLPFTALPRPSLTDLAKDLLRQRDGEK